MNCMPDDNSKVGKQKDLIRLPLPSPLCPVSNNEIYVCNTMYKVCMWCECEMWTQIDDNSGAKNPICLPLPSSLLGLMMDTRHETHLWYLIYPCQQLSSSSSSTEQKHVECYIYIYSRAHNKMSWWYVYCHLSHLSWSIIRSCLLLHSFLLWQRQNQSVEECYNISMCKRRIGTQQQYHEIMVNIHHTLTCPSSLSFATDQEPTGVSAASCLLAWNWDTEGKNVWYTIERKIILYSKASPSSASGEEVCSGENLCPHYRLLHHYHCQGWSGDLLHFYNCQTYSSY